MRWSHVRVLLCAALLAAVVPVWGQLFRLPKIDIPGLGGEKDESPVTTSLKDAVTEVPVLDEFSPSAFQAVDTLGYQPGEGFPLRPGAFAVEVQSYSLDVGAYGPGKGERYLYAPLAGPQSSQIQRVLERSALHPDISQRSIQILIWAIAARTNCDELVPEEQQAVARLLTRGELAGINQAAEVTDEVRGAVDRENTLRVKLATGPVVFEELERIAVRTGEHALGPDSREVPAGRWSYHPGGYFLRLSPSGYSRTRIEVSVPPPCAITRDGQGRMARIEDNAGHALTCRYGAASLEIPRDKALSGAVLEELRFTGPAGVEAAWSELGWVFVGIPNGKSRPAEDSPEFSEVQTRYEQATQQSAELNQLVVAITHSKKRRDQAAVADLLDLQRLRAALASASGSSAHAARLLLDTAWQDALVRASRGPQAPPRTRAAPGVVMFDPTDSVAVPADTAGQRLALSPRPARQ
jgi:hypothetical protein